MRAYAGSYTAADWVTVVNDAPPVIAIAQPVDGDVLAGTVAFQATASDDGGVSNVKFYVDGLLVATDLTSNYTTNVSTGSYTDGSHTLTAMATDTALQTTSVSVTVDLLNPGWTSTSVDSTGDVGTYARIALDASDVPHVVYFDATNEDLKHAWNDGAGWTTETVATTGCVGTWPSLAFDASGDAWVSYLDCTSNALMVATDASGAWMSTTVDTGDVRDGTTDIAVSPTTDVPTVCYHSENSDTQQVAWYSGGAWSTFIVDNPVDTTGLSCNIAFDSTGEANIFYVNDAADQVELAQGLGTSWTKSTLTEDYVLESTFGHLCATIDDDDVTHLGFYDNDGFNLVYGTDGSGSWEFDDVDTSGRVGQYCGIAVDDFGLVHMSYHDDSNGNLTYAVHNGYQWTAIDIVTTNDVGTFTSIAVDSYGYSTIAYVDETNDDLVVVEQ